MAARHEGVVAPPHVLEPIVRGRVRRTSDRVYDELLAAIRQLRLGPGDSISETGLAEQLGVSRTPVREAIARLVDAGLVVVTPQVGTRVAPIRLRDVEEARFMRENLEVAAFAVACGQPNVDPARLHELLWEQERSGEAGDYDAFNTADEALHGYIFAVSGYPGAWQSVQRMKVQLDRLRRLSLPEERTMRALVDEHAAIVRALEQRDVRRGQSLISEHARRVIQYLPALRASHPNYFTE